MSDKVKQCLTIKKIILFLINMQSTKKEIQIAFRVDIETRNALQLLADNDKRKLSDFIRIQLEKVLEANQSKKSKVNYKTKCVA